MARAAEKAAEANRPADVRGEILLVATRLFAAHGYEGTSLQDIAEAIGIRKQSLLYHFPSKQELRQAVLEGVLAHWNEALPRLLVAATAGEDQFHTLTRELLAFFQQDPDRARLLIRETLDRPDDMRSRLERHVSPIVANLAGYVRKGQKHGALHPDVDPEAYLFQVVALMVFGIAVADRFGGLLPESKKHGVPEERLQREVLRIAKSSLFLPDSAPEAERAAPRPTSDAREKNGRARKARTEDSE